MHLEPHNAQPYINAYINAYNNLQVCLLYNRIDTMPRYPDTICTCG